MTVSPDDVVMPPPNPPGSLGEGLRGWGPYWDNRDSDAESERPMHGPDCVPGPEGQPSARCVCGLEETPSQRLWRTVTRWNDISTAPKTGEHILVAWFDGGIGFGYPAGKHQPAYDVVHWWDGPEPGWYPSNGPDEAVHPTHWMALLLPDVSLHEERVESRLEGRRDG